MGCQRLERLGPSGYPQNSNWILSACRGRPGCGDAGPQAAGFPVPCQPASRDPGDGGGPAPVPAQGVSPFAGPVMGQAKGAPDLIQHLQAGHDPAADEQGFGDQKGNCR